MPLHPEIAKIIPHLPPPAFPLDPVAMRVDEESHVPPLADRLPVEKVEDTTLVGVPVRLYTPSRRILTAEEARVGASSPSEVVESARIHADSTGSERQDEPTRALTVVYIHGGAFFLGSLETHDHIARNLANATGLEVVSVGYRLAPEHAYPAGLEDCFAVVRHLAEQGRTLALVGDSSGGTFVAALAAMAYDAGLTAVTHQVLLYPSLDLDFDESRYPSLVENAVGYGLETAGLKPFNAFYIESGADPADPRVSPIKRSSFEGLPKALILTGELDPLRDEGELYGELLTKAGVDATVSRYDGAGHGFVQHFCWLPEYAKAYAEIAAFLKD